jgi:hypothetical protein
LRREKKTYGVRKWAFVHDGGKGREQDEGKERGGT